MSHVNDNDNVHIKLDQQSTSGHCDMHAQEIMRGGGAKKASGQSHVRLISEN